MNREGHQASHLTDDELQAILEVVCHGGDQAEARRRVSTRGRVTVARAYRVFAEFERSNLDHLDDKMGREIAERIKYETTLEYVQKLFSKWQAWRRHSRGQNGDSGDGPQDPELGPHGRELLYFGQRFRDLASVPSPSEVVRMTAEEYAGAMWQGWPAGAVVSSGYVPVPGPASDPVEKAVASEWGFLRYDAQKHSLFPAFKQHLSGHACWERLKTMEATYNKYGEACRLAYETILGKIKDNLPNLSAEKVEVLAKSLLEDGLYLKKNWHGIGFSYNVHEVSRGGLPTWELELGARRILSDDPEELRNLADVHQHLRASPPYDADLKALADAERTASGAVAAFRATLTPDALLRKLVLNGRCDWCP